MSAHDPFAEGAEAARDGLDVTDNPYDFTSEFEAFSWWVDGWDSVMDEAA